VNALEVAALGFAYGTRQALQDVSFSVAPGRFAALLGPNGAGKSTLIALLTRLYDLQQGDIQVLGHSLQQQPRQALRQLGVVFQQSTLDLDLSVEQNLRYHAALHGLGRRAAQARIDEELARQQLEERRRDKVRTLNGGHRRRVEIARALLHRPRLLLLDEASAGLDPASRLALNRHVRQLCRDEGLTVLWTTHLLDEVQASDERLILGHGRLVAQGHANQFGDELGASIERLTAEAPCLT
jgi:ABC-2 type transport system ATP-binding protein